MNEIMKICPECNEATPLDSKYCKNCGYSFAENEDFSKVQIPAKYFSGYLISDLETIIGKKFEVYMDKFRKRKKGDFTFNWCAALFGYYWLSYRWMTGQAFKLFCLHSLNLLAYYIILRITESNVVVGIQFVIDLIWFLGYGFYGDLLYWRYIKKKLYEEGCFKRPPVYDKGLQDKLSEDSGTMSIGATIGILFIFGILEWIVYSLCVIIRL